MRRYALAICLDVGCWLLGDGGVSGKDGSFEWEENGTDGMAGIMRLIRPAKHPPGTLPMKKLSDSACQGCTDGPHDTYRFRSRGVEANSGPAVKNDYKGMLETES